MRNYAEAEEIRLIFSGSNFFETVDRIIDEAREVIHLQTYIFDCDETGMRVVEGLRNAAMRGVQVFLMVDAYASFPFSRRVAADLRKAGVHFRLFSPIFSNESLYIARRMHHKILVADKFTGLIGGVNIANKYNTFEDVHPWLDYAALIRGPVCEYLHVLCEQFYFRIRPSPLKAWEKKPLPPYEPPTHRYVRFRRNDWIRRRNEIHRSYVEALLKAETSAVLVASYFLPNRQFRKLLRQASARGVQITVIMAGRSDISTLLLAENFMYDFYLRHNIRLFEWNNSVLHGKAMIVDNTWVTIGSYNLNFLSHYISIELNADVIDRAFVKEFSEHLDDITRRCCIEINLERHKKSRNPFMQFLRWLLYNFYRLIKGISVRGSLQRRRLLRRGR